MLIPALNTSIEAADFHGVFSDTFCKMPIDFVGHMLANVAWTGTLTLRVRALWLQQKYLVWGIYVFYALTIGTFLITASLANNTMLGEYPWHAKLIIIPTFL